MARFGLLLVLLVGCGHAQAGPEPTETAPPVEVGVSEAPAAEAPVAAARPAGGKAAQVITFGDDEDAEPTMMVRSAPARPKIPAFQLYGTRTGDGPR